jgi:hypothetical protein
VGIASFYLPMDGKTDDRVAHLIMPRLFAGAPKDFGLVGGARQVAA